MNRRSFLKVVGGTAAVSGSTIDVPRAASGTLISIATDPVSSHLHRVRSGQLHSISAVRDGGIALLIDDDDSSQWAMFQHNILPGHVRTCVAEGLVLLGSWRVFDITFDGRGIDLEQLKVSTHALAGAVDDSYLAALTAAGLIV